MKVQRKTIKNKLTTAIMVLYAMLFNMKTYAATTIGTEEFEIATQNIIDAVIKLSMPIRNSFHVH